MTSPTATQIACLVASMPEGDRLRVLRFCEAIAQQRQGKRQQRRARWEPKSTSDKDSPNANA